jgi:hypothetical protein
VNTFEGAIELRTSGENDDNAPGVDLPDGLNDRVSVLGPSNVEVANQNVESVNPYGFECFRYRCGYIDYVPAPF